MPHRAIRRRLLLSLATLSALHLAAQTPSRYAQTIRRALFNADPRGQRPVEVLVLDLRTRELLVDSFRNSAAPIPVGSLLKPFLALAWLQAHPAPTRIAIVCHGHVDGCWRASGHGSLTLPEAIAQSCNAYFLALAAQVDPANIPYLPSPPAAARPSALVGLSPEWLISPRALLESYALLLSAPLTASSAAVRHGMALAATSGTASHLGRASGGLLAKTGTAPCVDPHCLASGDGLVLAAAPASRPTLLLLVRRRGTTGSATAADVGRLLRQLQALHAY